MVVAGWLVGWLVVCCRCGCFGFVVACFFFLTVSPKKICFPQYFAFPMVCLCVCWVSALLSFHSLFWFFPSRGCFARPRAASGLVCAARVLSLTFLCFGGGKLRPPKKICFPQCFAFPMVCLCVCWVSALLSL